MTLNKVWLVDQGDDPYRLPNISDEEIRIDMEKLGVQLPEAYIELIKQQNGGRTFLNAYPVDFSNSWSETHINLDFIYGIGKNEGILDSEQLKAEWDLPLDFILLSGDGHTWIAFDYTQGNEPTIVYYDVNEGKKRLLAKTFSEFLSKLYHFDHDDLELYNEVPDITFTKEEGERILNIGEDIEEITMALIYFQNNHRDPNWFLNKLPILVNHDDPNIFYTVADSLMVLVNTEYEQLDQKLLLKTIQTIEKHKHPDGKMYAESIRKIIKSL